MRTPTRGIASIDGHSYPPRYIESVRRNKATLASVRDSDTSTRPFVFDKINLTDDDNYLDAAPSQQLGEIEIVIHSVQYSKNQRKHYPPKRGQGSYRGGRREIQTVYHERRKKGSAHQAKWVLCPKYMLYSCITAWARAATFPLWHHPLTARRAHRSINRQESQLLRSAFDIARWVSIWSSPPLILNVCSEILRAQEIIPRPVGEVKREEPIDVDEWEEPEVPEIQYMGVSTCSLLPTSFCFFPDAHIHDYQRRRRRSASAAHYN